jgi:hypothetical protein
LWEKSGIAMNESQPPVLEEKPKPNDFVKFAAAFSILSPLIAILIYFSLKTFSIICLFPWLLILLGFIFGIVALVLAKRQKGILIKSIVGIGLNSLMLMLLFLFLPLSIIFRHPITAQEQFEQATNELAKASTETDRFYALDDAAKENFNAGKIQEAENEARELLVLAPKYRDDWNYGNAIQDGNLVLGRITVRDGRIEDAKKYLLEAGKSLGSPQMNSFGPNMSLAKDLLEKGEHDTVLQYFELCRKFWKMDSGKLNEWSKEVKAGETPDFGANLAY